MRLDKTQGKAICDLVRRLTDSANRASGMKAAFDPSSPVRIQFANTFGVLGPRGAGKSTLLSALYEAWRLESPQPSCPNSPCQSPGQVAWNPDSGARSPGSVRGSKDSGVIARLQPFLANLRVFAPLDCSIIDKDLAPGAAILLHLKKELEASGGAGLQGELGEDLRGLAESYVETTPSSRLLYAELATTSGEYTRKIMAATKKRLELRNSLAGWLRRSLQQLDRKAFVVLLDDFDLVHAREVRSWLFSLLDELHQERLLFVLTADFYRLEHLSFDPEAEIDDLTGRALLDKLLPSQNRINLERWGLDARSTFSFEQNAKKIGLKDRIRKFALGSRAQELLLGRLLPGWPRGLLNLFSSLGDEISKELGEAEARRFLGQLASCRGEPLLARELQEATLTSWVTSLRFEQQSVSVEAWREAVEKAGSRWRLQGAQGRAGEVTPIPILRPDVSAAKRKRLSSSYSLDISGRDVLRHEDLRHRPMKDGDDRLIPIWVETLLNYVLMDDSPLNDCESTRNRVRFLDHWPPVASRLSDARFKIRLSRQAQRSFFEDHKVPASALLWLRWKKDLDSEVSIGWEPLLSALRGERSVWQVEAMKDLLINQRQLTGNLPPPGEAISLRLVPDQVWAIILLTDGLDRCPWKPLSLPLGWELRTYILLSALFVRTAYVYALDLVGALPETLSDSQKEFLTALKSQDPLGLLKRTDEQILKMGREIAHDGLDAELKERTDPISKAAHSFLESLPYQALGALVEDR